MIKHQFNRLKEVYCKDDLENILNTLIEVKTKTPIIPDQLVNLIKLSGEMEAEGFDTTSILSKNRDPIIGSIIYEYEKMKIKE